MADISQEVFQISRNLVYSFPEDNELTALASAVEQGLTNAYPEPGSEAAKALFLEAKPLRFAYLARAIKVVFDEALSTDGQDSPFELPAEEIKNTPHPWRAAKHNMERGFDRAISRAATHDDYINAEQITDTLGDLHPARYTTLKTQLTIGARTACGATTVTLMNIPRLAEHYAPETPPERMREIATQSSGIVYELMRRSVNSLMVAREAITVAGYWDDWAEYNPEHFRPLFVGGQLHSLRPIGIEDIVHDGQKVSDSTDPEAPAIGCPLTLLHGSYKQLWSRAAEAVDAADLWCEA